MENTVKFLQSIDFSSLTFREKLEIKNIGRPTPKLTIEQIGKSRNKEYVRKFSSSVYDKYEWICGCEERDSLFCFPCLLFGGDVEWTQNGISNLKNLPQKVVKHQHSQKHLTNIVDLTFLGKLNIKSEPTVLNKLSIASHNDLVNKNRYAMSKIIDCILFCGEYELTLEGYEERDSSQNPGVLRGLIDFLCKSDSSFETHFKTASAFQRPFEDIENELLDAILNVCKIHIKEEIQKADYLSIIYDEAIDACNNPQVAIFFRYELNRKPVERFWGFCDHPIEVGRTLSDKLLNQLDGLITNKEKLIAQTYGGTAVIIEKENKKRIKEVYKNAHFVYCYTHDLDLIIQKVTSRVNNAKIFFNSLFGIPKFFSKYTCKRTELKKLGFQTSQASPAEFDFKKGVVNTVYERKNDLVDFLSVLETSQSAETGFTAANIKRTLSDSKFSFWLEFFSKIMHHLEILLSQLYCSWDFNLRTAQESLNAFSSAIEEVKQEYNNPFGHRILSIENRACAIFPQTSITSQLCDIILQECIDRFSFLSHLEARKLLISSCFLFYLKAFPAQALNRVVENYPMLDKAKLQTEPSVMCGRGDLFPNDKFTDMLNVLSENNLEKTFPEIVKLVKILITTPMPSEKPGKSFSLLKRGKGFPRNPKFKGGLSNLAMISTENEMINDIKHFNEKVINHFATSRTIKTDFIYNAMNPVDLESKPSVNIYAPSKAPQSTPERGTSEVPKTPTEFEPPVTSPKSNQNHTSELEKILRTISQRLSASSDEDEFDHYGKFIAAKVRNMDQIQGVFAQKLINEVIFEGEMGTLSRKTAFHLA